MMEGWEEQAVPQAAGIAGSCVEAVEDVVCLSRAWLEVFGLGSAEHQQGCSWTSAALVLSLQSLACFS